MGKLVFPDVRHTDCYLSETFFSYISVRQISKIQLPMPKNLILGLLLASITTAASIADRSLTMAITDSYDEEFTVKARSNLRAFHQNLSKGQYAANGPLIATDFHWNYDGTIILTRDAGITALTSVVETAFRGLDAPDIYNIVDGDRAAVLFWLQGKQTGPFLGLPLQPDGRFKARSAEYFIFNDDALTRDVVTLTPISLIKAQMQGQVPVAEPSKVSLPNNPQTSPQYRNLLRRNLMSIHLNANARNASAIRELASDDVEVDENGSMSRGKDAFVDLVTANNAGKSAFPEKAFHAFDVLADGQLGAVSYVWHGVQQRAYNGMPVKEGATVRMRGMLFFEFDDKGLIRKAIGAYDEGVVNTTLAGTGGYLYP